MITDSAPDGRAVILSRIIFAGHLDFVTNRWLGKFITFFASGVLVLYLALPLIVILVRALETSLIEQLAQPTVTHALRLSLITTPISTLITIGLGTPLAYRLARSRVRGRSIIETLLDIPIVLPPAVAGLALLMTFGRRGLIGPLLDQLCPL